MSLKTEIKWGLILALALFVYELILWSLGFHSEKIDQHAAVTSFGLLPPIACLAAGIIEKRKGVLEDKMTYMQALIAGILIAGMSLPFQALFTWMLLNFISPDYFETAIAAGMRSGLEEEGLRAYFNMKSYLFQTVVYGMGSGVFFSLLLALVLKKK